jgi:hypothetical protein
MNFHCPGFALHSGPQYSELMTAKLNFYTPVVFCLCFAAALFGQIDSYQLHANYGLPLARETFTISPGFQIVIDYGPDQQASRLELPPAAPSLDQPGVITQKRVDDILLELVPMSMRGKELGGVLNFMSRASWKSTDYEQVIINEPQDPDVPGRRTGVTVVFKSSATSLLGQIDSYHLRAKYGPPIARETFTIAPAFQMIVDYGPDQQACRLELPADQSGVLLELVPPSMRGKQLQSWSQITGAHSAISTTEYEHVGISQYGDASNGGPRTSVTFKRDECRSR